MEIMTKILMSQLQCIYSFRGAVFILFGQPDPPWENEIHRSPSSSALVGGSGWTGSQDKKSSTEEFSASIRHGIEAKASTPGETYAPPVKLDLVPLFFSGWKKNIFETTIW